MKETSFKEFVLDQFSSLEEIDFKAMFGGHGLYHKRLFFGILHKGRLYFKTDSATRPDYIALEMKPFRPSVKQTLKNYYEIPIDILEDPDQLIAWAEKAIACQKETS